VGLVLFAHGSLLCDGARTLQAHADQLARTGRFECVEIGFLNYNEPPIEEAVRRCVFAGVHRVVVVPWFLVPGKFVREDLPPRLEAARCQHPEVQLDVAPPLGPDEGLGQLIADSADMAVGEREWDQLPANRSRRCEQNPNCPYYNSDWCRMSAQEQVTPGDPLASPLFCSVSFGPGDVLLLIAHGSPRTTTMAHVERALADGQSALEARLGLKVPGVAAYLDCNQPDIPDGVVAATGLLSGTGSVVVVPFFLHAGKHVARDLPALIREGQARVPWASVRLGPHIGCLPSMAELALKRAGIVRSGSCEL
jgi:sirohydrochlorin ferrochelatase